MFRVVIQLGAILAVVVLFWHKLWPFGLQHGRVVSKLSLIHISRKPQSTPMAGRWALWPVRMSTSLSPMKSVVLASMP